MNHVLPSTTAINTVHSELSNVPKFMSGLEMLRETPTVKWRLKDFLLYSGLTTVFSKPGVGKTHFVVGLLFHIAHGIPFLEADVAPCTVCYVAGEGNSGVRDRYEALLTHHGIEAESDNTMLFTDGPTELASEEAVQGFVSGLLHKLAGRDVGVIVIDTLARNFTGDENDATSMKRLIRACDQLISTFKCLVILVHHSNKSSTSEMRGSSVLEGALDTIYAVERSAHGIDIVVKKQKYGPEAVRMKCSYAQVELPPTESDTQRSAPIIQFDSIETSSDQTYSEQTAKKAGGSNQEVALSLLGKMHLSEAEWKALFMEARPETSEKSARAFRNALAGLKNRGLVSFINEKYSISGQA